VLDATSLFSSGAIVTLDAERGVVFEVHA